MRLKVSEKGNRIWIEVENVCEAYGWNDSKTCIVEYVDVLTDKFGTTAEIKKSVLVFEKIDDVIRKIEKERAKKDLKINKRQRAVFSRWRK